MDVIENRSSICHRKNDKNGEKQEGVLVMKDYMKIYQEWLDNPYFDEATKEELRANCRR